MSPLRKTFAALTGALFVASIAVPDADARPHKHHAAHKVVKHKKTSKRKAVAAPAGPVITDYLIEASDLPGGDFRLRETYYKTCPRGAVQDPKGCYSSNAFAFNEITGKYSIDELPISFREGNGNIVGLQQACGDDAYFLARIEFDENGNPIRIERIPAYAVGPMLEDLCPELNK